MAALLALLAAAIFLTRRPGAEGLYPPRPGEPTVAIYIVDNGFHTNVVLPTEAVRAHGGLAAALIAATPQGPWMQFGWGDARFYIDQRPIPERLPDGLRALFGPHNRSAVMLEPLRDAPDRLWRTGVVRIELGRASADALLRRVEGSLALADGKPVLVPSPGLGEARFFRSREAFSVLHLCNHWTSGLLHAAGVKTRPVLDTVSGGVMLDAAAARAELDRTRQGR